MNLRLTFLAVALVFAASTGIAGAQNDSMTPSAGPAGSMINDVYPLYANLTWTAEQPKTMTLGTLTLTGIQAVSQPVANVTDLAAIFKPFEAYYANKLQAAGWSVNTSLAAAGPGAATTVYTKGQSYAVVGYSTNFKGGGANAPAQCPCDITLSVFTTTAP